MKQPIFNDSHDSYKNPDDNSKFNITKLIL